MSRSKGGAVMPVSQSPDDFSGEDDEFPDNMGLVAAFATNARPGAAARVPGKGANLASLDGATPEYQPTPPDTRFRAEVSPLSRARLALLANHFRNVRMIGKPARVACPLSQAFASMGISEPGDRSSPEAGRPAAKRGSGTGPMDEGIDMMRSIKRALDPQDIMNPGKIFSSTQDRPRCTAP